MSGSGEPAPGSATIQKPPRKTLGTVTPPQGGYLAVARD
jgi:hypothetical protein